MDNQVDQVASALGALPELSPETHKELERLSKPPYFLLPKVKSCHTFLDECRLGKAHGRIVGDSGVGKTVAAKAYAKRLKEISDDQGALCVLLEPNCTPTGFYQNILGALETYKKGDIHYLRNRTCQALLRRQIAVLLIDEASFLKRNALGELLYLVESGVVPSIFLIGTHRLDALLGSNEEQVDRRYPRYQYGRVIDAELKHLIELWEKKVLCLPGKSNLTSTKPMKLLISATGGYIGKMDEILRRAARKALILGESKISYATLQEVASQF